MIKKREVGSWKLEAGREKLEEYIEIKY